MEHYRVAADEEPEASYALGFELEKRDQLTEAAAEYERYLKRQPDGGQALAARIRLGVTLMRVGRLPEAAKSLEGALDTAPNDPDALGAYGHALAELGRAAEAVRVFERLVTITPEDAEAHQSLGLALLAERRAADAIGPFERAVALAPRDERKHAYARLDTPHRRPNSRRSRRPRTGVRSGIPRSRPARGLRGREKTVIAATTAYLNSPSLQAEGPAIDLTFWRSGPPKMC